MKRVDVLEKAKQCVCGDRQQDYGNPENSFAVIAKLWSAFLGVDISPCEAAAMMALFKLGRIKTGHSKDDNWIDLAGYAACGAEIQKAEAHDVSEV